MSDGFEFETELGVRFRDIDPMGHVNNAVYATFLEQARADYFDEVVGVALADIEVVLASLEIEFHEPVAPGETVTVAVRVPEIGETSLPMEYQVRRADGSVAATAETVQVGYDRETGTTRRVPDAWREAIRSA